LLASLVRKEIVSLAADPFSPERGQYGFLQDLVKKVAYDTLSRRDRKTLHLAAAAHLQSSGDEEEIVEVLAAHLVDAYKAAPDDPDAGEIRDQAREMLVRAAERAASLAANEEAQHAYERAAELSDDPLEQADLHEHAGLMARTGARNEEGAAHYEKAIALFEGSGATHPAARVSARLAEVMWDRGRLEHGLEIMDRSYQVLAEEEPDADLAALAAQLGRFMFFAGQHELALQRLETALGLAEALLLPEVLSQALTTKGTLLASHGRKQEGLALMRFALDTALEHDKPSAALRASYNLADTLAQVDRYDEAIELVRDGLNQARRIGNRYWEWSFLNQLYPHYALGEWNEALEMIEGLPEGEWRDARQALGAVPSIGVLLNVHRGNLGEAARGVALFDELDASADGQEQAVYACGKARLLLADGNPSEALQFVESRLGARETFGFTQEYSKELEVTAAEAALALGDMEKLAELVASVDALPPGDGSHFLRAHSARCRAHLADRAGDAERAHRLFKGAAGLYREIGTPLFLGIVLLEHSEWLAREGRGGEAESLLSEAREIFDRLEARPWLERASQAGVRLAEVAG
jgi:predicted ATPase